MAAAAILAGLAVLAASPAAATSLVMKIKPFENTCVFEVAEVGDVYSIEYQVPRAWPQPWS